MSGFPCSHMSCHATVLSRRPETRQELYVSSFILRSYFDVPREIIVNIEFEEIGRVGTVISF